MNWLTSLLVLLSISTVLAVSNPAKTFGHGGHGIRAKQRLDYDGVMACVFELSDVNTDKQLSVVELRIILNRYLSTYEQALSGLTPHRIIAACDTDNSQQVSWIEAIEDPHCLTLPQVEGLAKWLCSRARQGDFALADYIKLSEELQRGYWQAKA